MSTYEPETPPPGALDAVTGSLERGWQRMLELMFTGPSATPASWMMWGLLIVLSGLVGGATRFSNKMGKDHYGDWPGSFGHGLHATWVLAAALIALFVFALMIVWLYFRSRFRLVFLDAVLSGRPQIRGVFGRTAEKGGAYFIFEIALGATVLLFAILPVVLLWFPVFVGLFQEYEPDAGTLAWRLVLTALWLVPLLFAALLLEGFVYDLTLPYLWRQDMGFMEALRSSFQLLSRHTGACVLLFLARVVVAIVVGILVMMVCCLTCFVWLLPALGFGVIGVGIVMATLAFPPLALVTIPLVFAVVLSTKWLVASITAPIYVFYRAWSFAFVAHLDPSVGSWEDYQESRATAP